MNGTKRILANTAATYIKTVATVLMALFSTRILIDSLGSNDFGLLNLFLSLVALTIVLNSTFSSGVSRYIAIAVGENRVVVANQLFNAAFWMHLILGVFLFVTAVIITSLFLNSIFTVPPSRLEASHWSMIMLLTAGLFSMLLVPYTAVMIAQQQLYELSGFGLAQSFLLFIWTLVLGHLPGDRLFAYCAGYSLISISIGFLQVARCRSLFPQFRLTKQARPLLPSVKSLAGFSAWNVIGNLGVAGRDQGTALLLNVSFGPSANAAYGVAMQVAAQLGQIATALLTAIAPEMNASQGRLDKSRVLDMAYRASKISSALLCMVLIPLLFEAEGILAFWLGQILHPAAEFVKYVMATMLIDRLTSGHMLAIQAKGKIAAYQISLGGVLIVTLPLTYVAFMVTSNPTSLGLVFLSTAAIVLLGRLIWGRILVSLSCKAWVSSVLVPVCLSVCLPSLSLWMISIVLEPSLFRITVSFLFSVVLSCCSGWFFLLSSTERTAIKELVKKRGKAFPRK